MLLRQTTQTKYDEDRWAGRVVLKPSKRARRLALRLDHKNRVFNLVVPRGVSTRKAYEFAHKHEDWIDQKLDSLPRRVLFEDGTILPLFGQDITLDIHTAPDIARTKVTLRNGYLTVRTGADDPTPAIIRFLKTEAKTRMGKIAHDKARQIDKTIKTIRIGDMKSRWGSCSHDGRISLSWRLIFAPPAAMDYVIAHEAAHLVHLDHSRRFWALCKDLSDHYVEGSYWIRNHGHELMRFG